MIQSFISASRSLYLEPLYSLGDLVASYIPRNPHRGQIDETLLDSVCGENSRLPEDLAQRSQQLVANYLKAANVSDERIQRVFIRMQDDDKSAAVCGSFEKCGWHVILLPRYLIEMCELEESREKAMGMSMLSCDLAHECAHIVLSHYDVRKRNLATLSLATYSIFFAVSRAYFPLHDGDGVDSSDIFHHLIASLAAKVTRVILVPIFIHRKHEFQADQLYDDISISIGGWSSLTHVQTENLKIRNSPLELSGSVSEKAKNICDWMYRKCRIASNGDSRSDLGHPPISQRLRYFENQVKQYIEANGNPDTIYI